MPSPLPSDAPNNAPDDGKKASRAFIRRLTHDVLQRSPTPRELSTFLGAPAATVVEHVLATREAMEMWLEEELFYFLLLDNFRPLTPAVTGIPERLRQRRMTVHQAIGEIVLSTSFSLRNPGNDTFVTVVLEQCLGMAVQDSRNKPVLEAGKMLYDGKKARFLGEEGQSQADVVKIVLAERRFTEHLLDRQHRRLCGVPLLRVRGKLTEASEAMVDRLHAEPAEFFPILAGWLGSDAYFEALATPKQKNDHQFVRSLYNDLLGRTPSYEELRNMRNALQSMADSSPLRAVMAKVILDSGEAEIAEPKRGQEFQLVRECFLRYLGRPPSQEEEAAFEAILAEPDTTARHVVRALCGSPEYQYY